MIARIQTKTGESIRAICATLHLPRSSYYQAASPTSSQREDRRLGGLIESVFRDHRRRYGYRRIHRELADHGIDCSPDRVRRLMRARGLRSLAHKRFAPLTSDGNAHRPAPNRLKDRPLPQRPNQVWAGDITYLPSAAGWLYLAVVIDLFSRRVIGWDLADHMRSSLVCGTLHQAVASRPNRPAGLIFHSDRGSQYGSEDYRRRLAGAGILQSMSAKANPYDNAWTESFIGTLKQEMLGDGVFDSIDDARMAIFDYIETYYNTKRRHSSLDYQSPNQAESLFLSAIPK